MKLQYNEKPASINNIGEDIEGAHRHNFNTYTDEQKTDRERKKTAKKTKDILKDRFKPLLDQATSRDSMVSILADYEFQCAKAVINSTALNEVELRAFVLDNRTPENVKAFNKFLRVTRKLSYTRESDLKNYFKSKKVESYQHITGVSRAWKTSEALNPDALNYFASNVKGIQFGNTLPESERVFNLNRLMQGLEDLKKIVNLDFKRIGFSFGARGRAGSVAHYQDSVKVIAINRNRCGSLVHEIGHALDYQKGMLSSRLPDSLVQRYREKVYSNPMLKINSRYLLDRKEIFARAFEAYVSTLINNDYLLDGDRTDWPELDESEMKWMEGVLK